MRQLWSTTLILGFTVLVVSTATASQWIVGDAGLNCISACFKKGMDCNATIDTGNSTDFFAAAGVNCSSYDSRPWKGQGEPSLSSDGSCAGYVDVPQAIACQASPAPSTRRICNCDAPNNRPVFTTGWSQGWVDGAETAVFSKVLKCGLGDDCTDFGTMDHFWVTPSTGKLMIRYYVDGESEASIQFTPSLASGVGFDDDFNPWGNEMFGKGAATGAWFWNFRVPFYRNITVTVQTSEPSVIYIILRGGLNVPVTIGGTKVPFGGRLKQHRINRTYDALDFVNIVDVPADKDGVFFMHTLSWAAPNLNTLEGCYHWFSPHDAAWPGELLSTGTEDFFDSAYYFDGGRFHLPVSGFTHLNTSANTPYGSTTFSAYRFHKEDPLYFQRGLRFVWRNGDRSDHSGIKCLIVTGGTINGSPGAAHVKAYGWVYEWDHVSAPQAAERKILGRNIEV